MKIRKELDLTKRIDEIRYKHEVKILNAVLKHYNITDDYDIEELTVHKEHVKNYSVGVITVRYKGLLMYRRFSNDFNELKFTYEAPIFNNVSEPK